MQHEQHIILFDGVCNLCNGIVQFVIKNDRRKIFHFASLQSAAGQKILANAGFQNHNMQSFVYVKGRSVYVKSDAALQVARQLGFPFKILWLFIALPKFIRDSLYDFIAKNRYRLFGKKDECMLPGPGIKNRFL